ncbi:hypothetical protein [Cohnella silvisoli]|uniref:Flp pilus-assembly TadG-like N-terminal domain-containing protein n=1 Tax=Cohnella silvisoli TaxID=2873699 RepID=A0ABV1KX44_9BACL|nr:hypothetical protein [Cohnella silvisoli]MCD9024028.1 hypothetical protein [Cohnella silvisoli]
MAMEGSKIKTKGTAGSVSIYFIVMTAAFVLLTALLIDFARVAAFRKQAELAVKSGVRSVLSSYDPVIYDRYGLFIRGGESANELFLETLKGNAATLGDGAFNFLDTEWEETDVTESRPLAAHDVFRRQILEEMKYKAPIDLALEMAQRFRGVSGAMKEASATVDLLERMRKAYDRRESALDEVLAAQRRYGEKIKRLLSPEVPYPPRHLSPSEPVGDVRTIVDIAVQYEDYVSKRQDDETRREAQRQREEEIGEADGPRYEAEVAAYESGAVSLASRLSESSTAIRALSEVGGEEAIEAYLKAKEANDEMRAIVEQAKSVPPASSDIEFTEPGSTVGANQVESMAELRKTAEELILDERFFEEYDAEIRHQQAQGQLLAGEAAAFSSLASSVPGSTGRGEAVRSGVDHLQSTYSEYVRDYGPNGSVCSNRAATLQAHRSYDRERKQEEQKAKLAWGGATHFMGTLAGVSGSEEEKADFEQVGKLYQSNREWNQTEEEQAKAESKNDPSEGRDEAMSASNRLMDILQGSLSGARDQFYFSEYTISRLSHYDPVLVKEMLHGGEAPLHIDQQEAEYILYGLNNPSANIAAAYGEVFAFRLAIRTMEGLIECRTMGHPLLVLAAALVYGIRNALLDLNLLVEKGTVQLSKYIKVDTVYTDYLRLFMLTHGGSANHLARMIAVMEHASGLSFRGAYTYASGEGTASVKLWFFPGLLKVMERYGNLGGTVKGNRYEATYTADSSYQ